MNEESESELSSFLPIQCIIQSPQKHFQRFVPYCPTVPSSTILLYLESDEFQNFANVREQGSQA